MRRFHARWLLPALFALAVANAAGQTTQDPRPTGRADPLDAVAHGSRLPYRSSLGTYRRLGDSPPIPWREANDQVGQIGGWRAYAREAQLPDTPGTPGTPDHSTPAPAPTAGAASTPMAKPMPGPHSGHRMP